MIPCWNDASQAAALAAKFRDHSAVHEIIVALAPEHRALTESLRRLGARVCVANDTGRGVQMNAGAKMATGDVLLFHHADSELTEAHLHRLRTTMLDPNFVGGAFHRAFDERHPGLRWLEPLERTHCRWFGTLYGDQSLFVRRAHFHRIGGFPDYPLMEDVEFSRRLRRSGPVAVLDPPMTSSPRRHLEQGSWRTTFRNVGFLLLYRLGVPPQTLHARYYLKPKAGRDSSAWAARWRAFRHPIDDEKARHLKKRWAELPAELQTANQISGRHLTHCAFTLGASYCSFRCTHCYLPENANRIPIPSFAQMKEQIDANRLLQGPGGGLQITGGDVADAYWRAGRADELIEIIRYADRGGLVPMLFTHGQTLIEQPDFLERLVVEGGLRQVAVHIDITQAGRKGYPIANVKNEADLHPVRAQFTALARRIREKTGAPLEFAHNCTVTRKNLDDVPEIIRWFLADPERTRIWRMLSFQPEADTGRTIFSERPVTPALTWEKIGEGVGRPLRRDASIFGHPDCNSWASLLVARPSGTVFPLLPDDPRWDRLLGDVLKRIGGLSLVTDDAGTPPYRLAGAIFKNPDVAARLAWRLGASVLSGKIPLDVGRAILRGDIHTVGVGMHNFMDAAQVANAPADPVTQCRLDSCVFKGAVKRQGKWEAVSMCAMNQHAWAEVYRERTADPALRTDQQIPGIHLESAPPTINS